MKTSSPRTIGPVFVEAELELRVGDDDPLPEQRLRGSRIELDRDPLKLGEPLVADEAARLLGGQRLVMALGRLRRRREDRLRKPVRLARDPPGSAIPQTSPLSLVALPARSGQVAADDALDRQHHELPALHRAAVLANRQQVIRDDRTSSARTRSPRARSGRDPCPGSRSAGRRRTPRCGRSRSAVGARRRARRARGPCRCRRVRLRLRHERAPPCSRWRADARRRCRRGACSGRDRRSSRA